MADTALSALTAASTLDGTELYYTAQGGADRKATGSQIRALVISYAIANPQTWAAVQTYTVTPISTAGTSSFDFGANSGNLGQTRYFGSTSGSVTVKAAAAAGTATIFQLPATNGSNGQVLKTDGAGITSWTAASGGGDLLAANNLSDVANAATAFGNIKQTGTSGATGALQLASTGEAQTGTDTAKAVTCAGVKAAIVGLHTVGAAAGTLFPATTNGCTALAQFETATNKINYKYLSFDPTTVQYAWFLCPTPKSYNASTVTMRATWTHPATTTNFGVVWQFEILSLSDLDAGDTAVGTAVTVTDTGGTTGTFYQAAVSGAITPSNTIAKGDVMLVRVSRLATNGSDTMAVNSYLTAVELFYTTDARDDT